MFYHDRYWGGASFLGSEMIWQDGKPVWGMNYYGGSTGGDVDTSAAYNFLKVALLAGAADRTITPARGPRSFTENDYTYTNTIEGDLSRFTGSEEVSKNGLIVCRHIYRGGLVR